MIFTILFEAPNYTIKKSPVISTLGISIQGKNYHSVRDLTLSLIREIFWKVNTKSLIKKGLFDRCYCKHQRVLPKPPLRMVIHRVKSIEKRYREKKNADKIN